VLSPKLVLFKKLKRKLIKCAVTVLKLVGGFPLLYEKPTPTGRSTNTRCA
jgi:hypothetical protein